VATVAGLLAGCRDVPTATVALCLPEGSDCTAFLSRNASASATVELGLGLFAAQCATCHGKDGRGMGLPGRGDFGDPRWHQEWSDADIDAIVTAGRGGKMPAFRLSPVELRSMVLFVRSLDESRGKADAPILEKQGQGPEMAPMEVPE